MSKCLARANHRPKANRILQMIRRQVRVAHGHGQAGVTQDFLQGKDVPAVLDEVTCEGVSQGVGGLAFG